MKVSIVIPVYNVEKYLRKCLESVSAQSDCVEEIILVNDGSTDGSIEICKEYAEKDKRFIIIDGENRGVEQATLAGVNATHGDYIGFVDGDDYIEPHMFQRLYSAITSCGTDMVMCGYDRVNESYEVLSRYSLHLPDNLVYKKHDGIFEFDLLPSLSGKSFMSYARWNKLFKREAIINNAFSKPHGLRIGEDTALIYSVVFSLSTICFVDEPLYHYVQRGNSIVHSFDSNYVNNWGTVVDVLANSANFYNYKIDNFEDVAAALLYHLCIGKVRLSKLSRKQRIVAYKTIGENKRVEKLLQNLKTDMPFKRRLVFSMLKNKHYNLLSLIY